MKQGVRDPGRCLQARGQDVRRQGRGRGAEGGELEGLLWTVLECWRHQGELGYRPELWKEREAYSAGIAKES